jgi:integrase
VDVVLVRQASAAHSASLALNDANLMAVGNTAAVQVRRSPFPFGMGSCHLHGILRSAPNQTVKWELVRRNVATLVKPPRVEKVRRQVLDLDQACAFLFAMKGDRLEALYTVGFAIGLRRAEALGLLWEDIDLASGKVTIQRELLRINGRLQLVPYAKGQSSLRTITLPAQALEALKEHRRRQLEGRLAMGDEWSDHGPVFTTGKGTPLDSDNVLKYFQRVLKRSGLPHQRLHDMRHVWRPCCSLKASPTTW